MDSFTGSVSARPLRFFAVALLALVMLASVPSRAASGELTAPAKSDCAERQLLTTATPIGVGPCDGVRPGGFHRTKIGGCTWNFLFKGSDGRKYMGTAGHCLISEGEKVWKAGGASVKGLIDGDEVRVGEAVYGVNDLQRDFGLVRLDKGVPASPKMCHFGGPSAGAVDPPNGTLLHHYGNGLIYGDTVPARTSVAADVLNDQWTTYSVGAALFGDSGSAVITEDGNAVGVLVHLSAAGVGISRLTPHLQRAEAKLGIDFRLQTAALE
jgi:hypothetical protein